MTSDEYEIDIASYPEFDNVVSEVRFKNGCTVAISKEPQDSELFVSVFPDPRVRINPGSSSPENPERIRLRDFLKAISEARVSLDEE